jgi:hypothetical protein
MKSGLKIFWLCTILTCAALFAQESLWRDQNPYVAPPREGEIVAVEVNENFQLVSDGSWNSSQKFRRSSI